MNVLAQALHEIRFSAVSLRDSSMVKGEYRPDPATAEEVERLERLAALLGHALEALGILDPKRDQLFGDE